MAEHRQGMTHIEALLREVIQEDPTREGLRDTPRRVVKSLHELTWGHRTPKQEFEKLVTSFEGDSYDEMVVVSGIRFSSLCEHHMLPFIGQAAVGYIPSTRTRRIIGLSKLPRLVQYWAARLQVQERLTKQIADHLDELLQPLGVGVRLTAYHTCMSIRGIKADGSQTTTQVLTGPFRDQPATRAEFLTLSDKKVMP